MKSPHKFRNVSLSLAIDDAPDMMVYWILQSINILSFLVVANLVRSHSVLAHDIRFSSESFDYLHSFRPFVPDVILNIAFDKHTRYPLQMVDVNLPVSEKPTTIYLPGIALDCLWGMLQGIFLAIYTLVRPSKLRSSILPSGALFFFAGMCFAALPLHSLKEHFDIRDRSLVVIFLHWMDTFCTASSSILLLLSVMVERNMLSRQKSYALTLFGLALSGVATAIGVILPNTWIMGFMHIAVMQNCALGILAIVIKKQIMQENDFSGIGHGLASVAVFVTMAILPLLLAWWVLDRWNGSYCVVTSFFMACRFCMVQFWAFTRTYTHRDTSGESLEKSKDL